MIIKSTCSVIETSAFLYVSMKLLYVKMFSEPIKFRRNSLNVSSIGILNGSLSQIRRRKKSSMTSITERLRYSRRRNHFLTAISTERSLLRKRGRGNWMNLRNPLRLTVRKLRSWAMMLLLWKR